MRILTDTNVLVTALGWPQGVPAQALWRVLEEERLVLTEYIVDEFRDVIRRKFPTQVSAAEAFLTALEYDLLPVGSPRILTPRAFLDLG